MTLLDALSTALGWTADAQRRAAREQAGRCIACGLSVADHFDAANRAIGCDGAVDSLGHVTDRTVLAARNAAQQTCTGLRDGVA